MSELAVKKGPRSWLTALGLDRPELRAWAMYDWANSAMVTTIIVAIYPTFFNKVAAAEFDPMVASNYHAAATTIGMTIIAILAPILGALADSRPIKKRLLGGFMAIGVTAVAAMFFIREGDWLLAAILFILANIGANGSFVFYDSLLPHIANEEEVDRVSTSGYALGYIGGGLLLLLNLGWILKPEWFGFPTGPNLTPSQKTLPARLSFVSVAVWWLVFSIPLFRKVPEPKVGASATESGRSAIVDTFIRLGRTLRDLKRYKQGFLMLIAFLIYNDGIGTIMRMSTSYGDSIGLSSTTMIGALVLVQFIGIPCAFGFGALAGKIGVKSSILISLVVYTMISILAYGMTNATHFFLLAILVGLVQGGSQALSRSLFSTLIPRRKSGEFFGFFAVVEKFAGIVGPLIYWQVGTWTGSGRGAILSVIGFFIVGGALLMMVDVKEGQRIARKDSEDDLF